MFSVCAVCYVISIFIYVYVYISISISISIISIHTRVKRTTDDDMWGVPGRFGKKTHCSTFLCAPFPYPTRIIVGCVINCELFTGGHLKV